MKRNIVVMMALLLSLFMAFSVHAQGMENTVIIVLGENPTTGYGWTYTANPDGVVREVSSEYAQDPDTDNLMGAWGKRTWVFEGASQGDAMLRFTYARPSEPDMAPAREVTFLIRVDETRNPHIRGSVEASGGFVFISLAQNPTTGYQWTVEHSQEGILNQEGDNYVPDASMEGLAGAGGMRVWRFAAAKTGEVTLQFNLSRSFEQGSADALNITFEVNTGLNTTLQSIE